MVAEARQESDVYPFFVPTIRPRAGPPAAAAPQ